MITKSFHKQSFSVPDLPTHSVTIYPSRAAIVRNIDNVTILPGRNEITLHNLTPNAEEHTINVECHNTAGLVTEMAVDLVANALFDPHEVFSEDDEYSSPNDEDVEEALSLKATIEKEGEAIILLEDECRLHSERLRMADEYLQSWTAKTTDPPSDVMHELEVYGSSRKNISSLETARVLIVAKRATVDAARLKLAEAAKSKSRSAAYKARALRKRERKSVRWERQEMRLKRPKDVYRVRITIELESPPKESTSTVAVAPTSRLQRSGDAEVPAGNDSGPSLRVSYVTSGASWTPRYDVRLDTLANAGVLTYRAQICNRTGETWKDARITLSTSQVSVDGLEDKAPRMDSWRITRSSNPYAIDHDGGLYSKKEKELEDAQERKRLSSRRGQKREYHEFYDDPSGPDGDKGSTTTALNAPSKSPSIATHNAEHGSLATSYGFPGTRTVISAARLPRYIIAQYKLTNISFSHITVPKLRPSAFLKARIRNPSPIALLCGPAGLSLDGTFLGTSTLPHCAPGGDFQLGLGVDELVLVGYRKPSHAAVPQGMLVNEQVLAYKRCISIYNTHKNPISLVVADQVPVSADKKLKVRVSKPSALGAGVSAKGPAAGIVVVSADQKVVGGLVVATAEMGEGGDVTWEMKVEGGTRIRIELEYEMTFPVGDKISEV